MVWVTAAAGGTQLVGGGRGKVAVRVGGAVLFTAMTFSHKAGRRFAEQVGPVGAVALRVRASASSMAGGVSTTFALGDGTSLSVTTTGPVAAEDITGQLVAEQYEAVMDAAACLERATAPFVVSAGARKYLAAAFVESDWVYESKYVLSPALGGWPQLGRIRFDPAVYWPRAVAVACHLLVPNVGGILAGCPDAVLDVLLVATITAFCGNYPLRPESRDDRGVGALKLDLNRDCDDMAISAAAVFTFMRATPPAEYPGSPLAGAIHRHLHQFSHACTVVCLAVGAVAAPGSPPIPPCGHVFAMLCRAAGVVAGALVVEATRQSSPHPAPIEGMRTDDQAPAFDPKIGAVVPLDVHQYVECFAVYTLAETRLCLTGESVGASLAALLGGGATTHLVACGRGYSKLFLELSHKPDYGQVDDECVRMGWGPDRLGITVHSPAAYPSAHIPPDFKAMANPRGCAPGTPAFAVTQFVAYCFI